MKQSRKYMFTEAQDNAGSDKKNRRKSGKNAESTKKSTETGGAFQKVDFRMLALSLMGVFILFVMGWGVCQKVKNINTAGRLMTVVDMQGVKKVEDNSKNAGKSIDEEAFIQKILDKVAFEAELSKLDDSVAAEMVEAAEGTKLWIYVGNGTYSDEVLVMTAKSESDAKRNQESVRNHLSEVKKAFQSYLPKEAKKVDQAVSIRCGCYVIVCVTSDYEKAEQTIKDLIKG